MINRRSTARVLLLVSLSLTGIAATSAATAAAGPRGDRAASAGDGEHHPRFDRWQDRCMAGLERRGERSVAKLSQRLAAAVWITDQHRAMLDAKIESFATAVDDAIAAASVATKRRELRSACRDNGLGRHFQLLRAQIRTTRVADGVDATLIDLQDQLDEIGALLADAEIVDADLLVTAAQDRLDNIDVAGVADGVLALEPTDDRDAIDAVLVEARQILDATLTELDGAEEEIAALTELLPDAADDPGDDEGGPEPV